jgi:hypothetical protein
MMSVIIGEPLWVRRRPRLARFARWIGWSRQWTASGENFDALMTDVRRLARRQGLTGSSEFVLTFPDDRVTHTVRMEEQ